MVVAGLAVTKITYFWPFLANSRTGGAITGHFLPGIGLSSLIPAFSPRRRRIARRPDEKLARYWPDDHSQNQNRTAAVPSSSLSSSKINPQVIRGQGGKSGSLHRHQIRLGQRESALGVAVKSGANDDIVRTSDVVDTECRAAAIAGRRRENEHRDHRGRSCRKHGKSDDSIGRAGSEE